MGQLSATDVADRLRDELERLVEELLPAGRREGNEWRAHGPDGAVWSVVLRGQKRGVFSGWGNDQARGDPLELVRWAACHGDRKQAFAWALRWLGEAPGTGGARISPEERRHREELAAERRLQRAREAAAEAERKRRRAHATWLEGVALRGSPAAEYLTGRGVGPERFPKDPLAALRFHPRAAFGWDADRQAPQHVGPAMVAAMVEPITGRFRACHHTFLEQRDGAWRKVRHAPHRPAKFILGSFAGAMIPLLRGKTGLPLAKAPDNEELALGEGIENCLSVGLAFPELRVAAAGAVQNLEAISLPPAISSVLLIHDRDGENDAVRQARYRAHVRWQNEKRAAADWRPAEGFKDANDWWLAVLRDLSAEDAAREGRKRA